MTATYTRQHRPFALGERCHVYNAAPRAAYLDIGGPGGHLANRRPFRGNSMSAFIDADGTYVVLSYATVIATQRDGCKDVIENRWGPTTARQINLCRTWL